MNLKKDLKELELLLTQALKDEIKRAGVDVRSKLYTNAEVVAEEKQDTVEVSWILQDYAQFVDRGRRPGRRPPVDEIRRWITDKKISTPDPTRLAWAISTSIAKKGIKARPFIDNYSNKQDAIIDAWVEQLFENLVDELLEKL